jgi:hypothetical protein
MKHLPTFLIIGPPKCASTTLHYYLGQHPDVYVPAVKETNFFTHDYYKGLNFYSKYFSDASSAQAIGEATPSYFFLPFALDRIKKDLPNAKLIVLLRNPIDRAFSHWLMFKESGVEKKSFREAIDINIKQLSEFNFEGEEGAKLWDDRRSTINDTEKWERIYLQPGLYAENIKQLYAKFDRTQIKIIFLEDLKNHFNETLESLFEFIGVDKHFHVTDKEQKNFYFNKKYFRLIQSVIGFNAAKSISSILPENIKSVFKQKQHAVKAVPKITVEDRMFLQDFYRPDIKELESILNRDMSGWMINSTQKAALIK